MAEVKEIPLDYKKYPGFGVDMMDSAFKKLYKKHGKTLKKIYGNKKLSLDDALSALSVIENSDKSYLELKEQLNPAKKQSLRMGGKVHRGRTAIGNKD